MMNGVHVIWELAPKINTHLHKEWIIPHNDLAERGQAGHRNPSLLFELFRVSNSPYIILRHTLRDKLLVIVRETS